MDAQDKPIIGTILKYLLEIEAEGFDQSDDDFDVEVVNEASRRSLSLRKSDMVVGGDGNMYLVFNSEDLGCGLVDVIITAHVPDHDLPGGTRDEICIIRRIARILPKSL